MGRATATATAKERANLDFKGWLDTGKHLAIQSSTSLFVIGDWLVSGMDAFKASQGEENIYKSASESTGYGVRYLQDICSTARRMPVTVRTVGRLTFNHHRVVCNLTLTNKYAEWLKRAADGNLSVRALAMAIKKAAKADPSLYPPPKEKKTSAKDALAKNETPLWTVAWARGITMDTLRAQIEKEWLAAHADELAKAKEAQISGRRAAAKKSSETTKANAGERIEQLRQRHIAGNTWKQRLSERVGLLMPWVQGSLSDFATRFKEVYGLELPLRELCKVDKETGAVPSSVFGRRFGWDYERALKGFTEQENERRVDALKIEALQAKQASAAASA